MHWQEQIRQYDDSISPTVILSDPIKRIMLKNTVSGIDDLHAVKIQADQVTCQQ